MRGLGVVCRGEGFCLADSSPPVRGIQVFGIPRELVIENGGYVCAVERCAGVSHLYDKSAAMGQRIHNAVDPARIWLSWGYGASVIC